MLKGFKDFILRGNVVDLAVAVVVGAAFTAIVTSLVSDLIEPVLGLITGNTDFSNYFYPLDGNDYPTLRAARDAGVGVFAYGSFITAVINFLIIAFVVFLLVKGVNRIKEAAMKKQVAEGSAAGPSQEALLAEIRDILAARARI